MFRVWEDKQTTQQEEIPFQYIHTINIEDTTKGIRISVQFYANNKQTAYSPERDKLGPKLYWAVPVLVILKTSLLTPSFV